MTLKRRTGASHLELNQGLSVGVFGETGYGLKRYAFDAKTGSVCQAVR